jgi:pyruvate dehydrogenase E2 component (dihydrolipoamide acetyltransferase)
VIAEIETDKATMEVEAVDEGTLGKILVPGGTEGVKVNEPIALLLEEGEDASALEGAGAAPQPPAKANGEAKPAAEAKAPDSSASPQSGGVSRELMPKQADQAGGEAGRIFASPLARRMAAQAGLDLKGIKGSGPHGRIVKADVEAALKAPRPAAAPEAAPAAVGPAAAAPGAVAQPTAPFAAAFEEVPLSNVRKVTAKRLTEAKRDIPHFYLTIECELEALLAMRAQLNAREGADYKLSVNDFVIKAVAMSLRKVPGCNASWGGDKIYLYKDIDIAVAVAIEGGLITPIIRRADQKGLSTISNEMKDLAGRAKAGKLKLEEFQGGGFSISNLGMFGIKEFSAVINPPQAAILAVGMGEKRPVVKGGEVKAVTMMSTTLSVDHRVIDGALGAQFLAEFKRLIEDPLALLL